MVVAKMVMAMVVMAIMVMAMMLMAMMVTAKLQNPGHTRRANGITISICGELGIKSGGDLHFIYTQLRNG